MVRLDKQFATVLMNGQAQLSECDPGDPSWIQKVEKLSQLCDDGASKGHIAFLGTAILAKALDYRADLLALKPAPDDEKDPANAFPARTLCHTVLVPLAAELGINLGVKGREPLNHQPYLRMKRLDDKISVQPSDRIAFDYTLELVREVHQVRESVIANSALRAFISVRRKVQAKELDSESAPAMRPAALIEAIAKLIADDPESGKRAQAILAGLLDVLAGIARVETRRNDPSRGNRADVCLRPRANGKEWEKVFEIHPEPLTEKDVRSLADKCLGMGTAAAALVMIGDWQPRLDLLAFRALAQARGLDLAIFGGWSDFVEQVLFWSELPKTAASQAAVPAIRARLFHVEASPASVELWHTLTRSTAAPHGSEPAR